MKAQQRGNKRATENGVSHALARVPGSLQRELDAKRGPVADDALSAPLPALARRLRQVAKLGSQVEKLLYARAAEDRLIAEQRRIALTATRPAGFDDAIEALASLATLGDIAVGG